jgi:purine-binding chemotaxis protein CheW
VTHIQGAEMRQSRDLDWEQIRQRIAAALAAVGRAGEISSKEVERIWAERAAQLARPLVEEDERERTDLVLVQLGKELYGLEARCVTEIRPAQQVVSVPRVPDWTAGVVNQRGRILSVIDLARFLGLVREDRRAAHAEMSPANGYLVAVEASEFEVALLVDEVAGVATLEVDEPHGGADAAGGIRPEYVQAIVEHWRPGSSAGGSSPESALALVVVLDIERLLADERLIISEEIA